MEAGIELAKDDASEAAGVGKTVVYNVLVTTRRDEVAIVVLPGRRMAELTGAAEGSTDVPDRTGEELAREAPTELVTAGLTVAVPWGAPG